MTEFKLQASVKDADGDMVNFRADSPEELAAYFQAFPYAGYAEAKAALRGAGNVSQIAAPAGQQPALVTGGPNDATRGWQPSPQQAQSVPYNGDPQRQQQPREGGWNNRSATLHPGGEACHCGKVLEYGKTRTNKGQWKCPDYRYNNGNPNDHRLEWAS